LAVYAQGQDRRVTPIVLPEPDLETSSVSGHFGQNDIEKPALPNLMARGVEVRTISAWPSRETQRKAKSGLHPSMQAIELSR
jgi:hypothetical protein